MTIKYHYYTAKGKLAYTKIRYAKKKFKFSLPNGKRADITSLPKLLYRLPELIASDPKAPVFVAEGEKDCDRLYSLGLVATCNYDGGGRGKWLTRYSRYFRDRDVVVLADNDWTGEQHAEDVASHLQRVTRSVRVVILPDLPPKGDVSDWLDAGRTMFELLKLASTAPKWRPQIELAGVDDIHSFDWDLRRSLALILSRGDLTAQEKLLLLVLKAKIARPQPTQATIASALSLSAGRVKKMLAGLRRRGVIRIVKIGRRNTYHLHSV